MMSWMGSGQRTGSPAILTAAVFLLLAKLTTRNAWIAAAITSLALVGLVQYAAEVWKVMFQLGFRP